MSTYLPLATEPRSTTSASAPSAFASAAASRSSGLRYLRTRTSTSVFDITVIRSSVIRQSYGTRPKPGAMMKTPSGVGSAKCSAYVILPRKYSALMKAKAIEIGTPSDER